MQTFKQVLKRAHSDSSNLDFSVSKALMQYRIMPHATTHKSLAEMFLNRRLRTRLDFILPSKLKMKLIQM